MITEIAAGFGTIETTVDLLKTFRNATQDEQVRSAVFEIQNDLLSLQEKLFEANPRFEEQSTKLSELRSKLNSMRSGTRTHPSANFSSYPAAGKYII